MAAAAAWPAGVLINRWVARDGSYTSPAALAGMVFDAGTDTLAVLSKQLHLSHLTVTPEGNLVRARRAAPCPPPHAAVAAAPCRSRTSAR
jgi:hypothetical protein